MEELKDRVKIVRKDLFKGSQAKFADELGVNEARIKSIENDRVKELSASEAVQMVKKFNLSPDWLLDGRGEMIDKTSQDLSTIKGNHNLTSEEVYKIPALELKASAGGGNHLESIDSFDSWRTIDVDRIFFKFSPSEKVRAIQVDGYSMAPMLMPDSWVFFELDRQYEGDGLYIINWRNILMVKKIQLDMKTGQLRIISVNPDYESYDVDPDDQSVFKIVGKVIRAII